MVSALLSSIGVPVLVQLLRGALDKLSHPAARTAAQALDGLDAAFQAGTIPAEQLAEANRHAENMADKKLREYEIAFEQINKSLRAEIISDDKYVRRMRPTFGYLMALSWGAQMLCLSYVIVFRTEQASIVLQAMESLGSIWMVGLSVLGIYVFKRSEDKKQALSLPAVMPATRLIKEVLSAADGQTTKSTLYSKPGFNS